MTFLLAFTLFFSSYLGSAHAFDVLDGSGGCALVKRGESYWYYCPDSKNAKCAGNLEACSILYECESRGYSEANHEFTGRDCAAPEERMEQRLSEAYQGCDAYRRTPIQTQSNWGHQSVDSRRTPEGPFQTSNRFTVIDSPASRDESYRDSPLRTRVFGTLTPIAEFTIGAVHSVGTIFSLKPKAPINHWNRFLVNLRWEGAGLSEDERICFGKCLSSKLLVYDHAMPISNFEPAYYVGRGGGVCRHFSTVAEDVLQALNIKVWRNSSTSAGNHQFIGIIRSGVEYRGEPQNSACTFWRPSS